MKQNCGMRQYHKGEPDERLLPMDAEPIITQDEWERLTALLTAPERLSPDDCFDELCSDWRRPAAPGDQEDEA